MDDLISRQAAIDTLSFDKEMLSRALDDMDVVDTEREKYSWGLGLIESNIYDIEELPSAQQCMTATSNTMMSDTVKIPVMDGTTERLPTADVMDDLIKRQDAITAYCEHECGIKGMTRENCGAIDCGTIFDDIPSAQQWIPCSERLPEKSGRYLVTNTRLGAFEVTWNIFYNGKGEAQEGWLYEDGTIAWMPLPEPYKGEE